MQPHETPRSSNPDALLSRELGTRQLAANVFNYTVGSGIFALPAFAVASLGGAAPLAYVACAVVIGLVVLCFAEAGSRVSLTGGAYAYVETALGPMIGFVAGCLVFTTGASAAAAVATLFIRSALALLPEDLRASLGAATPWLTNVLAVAAISLLVLINLRGVRTSARFLEGITLAKLLPLLAFVLVGVFFIDPANLTWEEAPAISAVLSTAGIVIFAFAGIEGATIPSGEVKDPARTFPRATLLALGAATLLYLAIQFVALGILGLELGNDRTTPLASAAAVVAGPFGRAVLIVGAVVSMFGYLSANVLSEPRGLFALSRDGFLPRILTRVHPRYHTPNLAIVVYGALVAAIALTGTFEQLAIFANLAALMVYFLCAVAALVLRRRDVRMAGEPFQIPGGPTVPIAACAAIVWLFYETVQRDQLIALVIVLVVIFALYGLRALRSVAAPQREN
jgi:basic amino acid/polyamine antiporter, APA family